ncbi:prepilin-type N-terminal cleavage/methylation domain-containing protein [Kiritimatiellaeota bacterium B1221]|nr:prepilin-type N-terminal cleavage/methylation domain-containing protein [Kiritimatiellaeota bacterium B1221]
MKTKSDSGFTLIEMLVVIAIIALLASILIPAITRALDSSKRIACLSNLRSLGQGTLGYVFDNNQKIPFIKADSGPGSGYANPPWFNLIADYVGAQVKTNISLESGTDSAFRCPSQKGDFAISYGPSIGAFVEGNSTLNYDWITSPSEKVWLLDVHTGYVYFFNPAIPAEHWAAPRHQEKINVLYFDGHVGTARTEELEAERPLLFQPTRN